MLRKYPRTSISAFGVFGCILAAGIGSAMGAGEFYVAVNGSDADPGTKARPFATVCRARDAVRARNARMRDDITVYLRGGTYHLRESIKLDDRDNGHNGHLVIYRNYRDETPIIIGGVPVRNWKAHKGKIMKANVGKNVEFWSLLVNGKLAEMAKGKTLSKCDPLTVRNVQVYYQGPWMSEYLRIKSKENKPVPEYKKSKFANRLMFLQGSVEFLKRPGEWALDSNGGFLYYWPENAAQLEKVIRPTVKSIFQFKGRSRKQPVENVIIQGLELVLTDFNANMRCYAGLIIDGYEHHGLDHPNTMRTALVTMENAKNIQVRFCDLHDAPLNGVSIYAWAQGNEVYGNRIENLGYSGIYLAGLPVGRNSPNVNKNNSVINNRIGNVIKAVNHATAVAIYQSSDNRIQHNLIHTSRRYGVSIKGARYRMFRTVGLGGVPFEEYSKYTHSNRNIISHNYIYDMGIDSSDGGGIESWGGGIENVADHNIIINAYQGRPFGGWRGHSLFLDDGSNYWTISNNIVWNTRAPAVNATCNIKGVEMKTFNNVFDIGLCHDGAGNLEAYAEVSRDHTYKHNIVYSDVREKTRQNGTVGPEPGPDRPIIRFNTIALMGTMDYNLYFNKEGKMFFTNRLKKQRKWENYSYEQWLKHEKGFDRNSIIADPQFVDVAARDYRLKETSPAFNLGIKSIDTSGVGLLKDFPFAPEDDPLKTVFLKAEGEDVYLEATPGKTLRLTVAGRTERWYVADLTRARILYGSSAPEVAKVDRNGTVTLKGRGRAVMTARVSLGNVERSDVVVIYSGQKRPRKR